jgi:DNA polymerase-3 subunit delta'
MSWDTILGHERVVEKLRCGCVAGRLAHAYAFVGPAGIGKSLFAMEFAKCLLCERHDDADLCSCDDCDSCQQVKARTHPDLLTVGLPEGKREIPIHLFIGEEESRGQEGLCYDITRKPMSARRRVAIIDNAEAMNEFSSNALLKTLEEPPPNSVLILIASSADGLLSTIRSRCQVVTFQSLATSEVQSLLVRQGMTADAGEAEQVAGLSDGSLETARQLLDPKLRNLREELYNLLAAQPFKSVQAVGRVVEALDSDGSEKTLDRESAGWIVRFSVEFFRRALLTVAGGPGQAAGEVRQVRAFAQHLGSPTLETIDRLADLVERSLAADGQLASNVSVPLCLEAFFDDVGKLLRQP